jgi:hypothetical protein
MANGKTPGSGPIFPERRLVTACGRPIYLRQIFPHPRSPVVAPRQNADQVAKLPGHRRQRVRRRIRVVDRGRQPRSYRRAVGAEGVRAGVGGPDGESRMRSSGSRFFPCNTSGGDKSCDRGRGGTGSKISVVTCTTLKFPRPQLHAPLTNQGPECLFVASGAATTAA